MTEIDAPPKGRTFDLGALLAEPAPDVPIVAVRGAFPSEVKNATDTVMSLLVGFGDIEDGGARVLLPYVETRIGSRDDAEGEPRELFNEILTLENAAYLVTNLAADIRIATAELADLHGSASPLEPARLALTRYFMTQAARECIASIAQLAQLLPGSPDAKPDSSGKSSRSAPRRKRASF